MICLILKWCLVCWHARSQEEVGSCQAQRAQLRPQQQQQHRHWWQQRPGEPSAQRDGYKQGPVLDLSGLKELSKTVASAVKKCFADLIPRDGDDSHELRSDNACRREIRDYLHEALLW